MTNWYPGNIDRMGIVGATDDVSLVPIPHPMIGDGWATDLGYHARVPRYGEQQRMDCDFLPDGYCYYEGSGLAAEPVLEAFLSHGPHAVWAALGNYYAEVFYTELRAR
jgi:hypothetical protein